MKKQAFAKSIKDVYDRAEDKNYDSPKKIEKKVKINSEGEEVSESSSESEEENGIKSIDNYE